MTDANDEALLRRLVVALAPVAGIEAVALVGAPRKPPPLEFPLRSLVLLA